MASVAGLSVDAVRQATAECDELGRDAFLAKYRFKRASRYLLVADGKTYDSKAIVAVAYKFVPEVGRALEHGELSGGVADAVAKLRALGFEVVQPPHDIDWTWDEHILALQLYLSNRSSLPGKKSAPVLELSALLNELARRTGVDRTDKFRNANGVYMKLMNFRRIDPDYQALGKVGLTRGADGEKTVWRAFRDDPAGLDAAARAIRMGISDEAVVLISDDDSYQADESKVILRLHQSRERNRKLIERKKRQVLAATGELSCEICSFDFGKCYGDHGRGFIEAHHIKPVSTLISGEVTKLSDLVLVCSNCHRMLHRGNFLLSTSSLRDILRDL